jgi:hypothetical protein
VTTIATPAIVYTIALFSDTQVEMRSHSEESGDTGVEAAPAGPAGIGGGIALLISEK